MDKQDAIKIFGSATKLAKATASDPQSLSRMKKLTLPFKLIIRTAAFLAGLVDKVDVERVRAEFNKEQD